MSNIFGKKGKSFSGSGYFLLHRFGFILLFIPTYHFATFLCIQGKEHSFGFIGETKLTSCSVFLHPFGVPDSPHRSAARVRFKSASLNCVDSPKKQNDDTCKYRLPN
jgi:hypothetical protein